MMVFFSALPYTSHKATPHFVDICFRFVQTTVFFFHFLCLLCNLSHTFINVYNLYFVLVHSVYIAHWCWTISSTFFSFLLSSSFSGKSSQEWSIIKVTHLYSKNCSKKKLAGFWCQSLVFQKTFMNLLIISHMLIFKS